ncbi:MAG: sulfite exporter TauE/SafE family protein [Methylovirgula sp.]
MAYYLMLFAAGFAGSFHCVGMCGGFACALGRDPQGNAATVLRHFLYNTGRLTTYCFLGGLAGAFGQVICTSQGAHVLLSGGSFDIAERILAIVAGLLMIGMAMQFFGLLPVSHRLAVGFAGSTFAMALRSLLAARSRAAALALGVFNGFLPCPLVYAFAAEAASSFRPLGGVLTMASFGLGTFPAMLMMGGVGRTLAPAWRRRGVTFAGGFILLLGLVTLARGILPMAAHAAHAWAGGHPA